MWGVIYYAGTGLSSIVVYGPFATVDAARAFRVSRDFPQNYAVIQCWPPPPYASPGTVVPVAIAAGQFVACLDTFNASFEQRFIVYGPWNTYQQGQVFIAGRPWPGGLSIVSVSAPP
jgi:hypothetical protein